MRTISTSRGVRSSKRFVSNNLFYRLTDALSDKQDSHYADSKVSGTPKYVQVTKVSRKANAILANL